MMEAVRNGAWAKSGGDERTSFEYTIANANTEVSFSAWTPNVKTEIDWGDGTVGLYGEASSTFKEPNILHTYADPGVYVVKLGIDTRTVRWQYTTHGATGLTRFFNLGKNMTGVSFADCRSLTSVVIKTDNPMFCKESYLNAMFFRMFSGCSNLTDLTFECSNEFYRDANSLKEFFNGAGKIVFDCPDGFAESVSNVDSCFNGTSANPPSTSYGRYTMSLNRFFYNCRLSSLILPEGFGTNATNLYGLFGDCNNLTYISLPDGFGNKATNVGELFIRGSKDLTIDAHGEANGIPISFSLESKALPVASAVSVLRTLPNVVGQTITLRNEMRTQYEANSDFMAQKVAVESRGWTVAYK